ncbi:MAG: hypothetical protein U0T83_09315 [Bacteriovoracaceae bacterium]
MKNSIAILSLTLMIVSPAKACLVKISQCREIPDSIQTEDKVVYEYNGQKITEAVYKVAASFTYSFKTPSSWYHPSRLKFSTEYTESSWMSSLSEAQAIAMKKCLFLRDEIVEAVPTCN